MKILSIETSCDETSCAIISTKKSASRNALEISVMSHIIHSQANLHESFGGIFPNLAKREHVKNIMPVISEALKQAELLEISEISHAKWEFDHSSHDFQIQENENSAGSQKYHIRDDELRDSCNDFLKKTLQPDIDHIVVTYGPGLEPALWVGIQVAEMLGSTWQIPVSGINHMEGHIVSAWIPKLQDGIQYDKHMVLEPELFFPSLSLLVSGGHTELVVSQNIGDHTVLGKTRDDAVGEAFDKVARLMDLAYPGGPKISQYATNYKEKTSGHNMQNLSKNLHLPRPMLHSRDLDFSFSGLKSAVRRYVDAHSPLSESDKEELAYEFQEAVVEVLISKTMSAVESASHVTGISSPEKIHVILAGGVSANHLLRERLSKELTTNTLHTPAFALCGDNALMIGVAGALKIFFTPDSLKYSPMKAEGSLEL